MKNLLLALVVLFLMTSSVQADFTVFDISVFFDDAIDATGNQLVALEGYENNNLSVGDSVNLPIETFQAGVPLLNPVSGLGFPDGLSNDSFVMNPLGSNFGLQWNITNGGILGGTDNSNLLFAEPLDFTMVATDVTAFGLRLASLPPNEEFEIRIFDGNGDVVFASLFDSFAQFFGVVADGGDTISRVEITPSSVALLDNATVWSTTTQVPEPASMVLFFPLCAALLSRQRKS